MSQHPRSAQGPVKPFTIDRRHQKQRELEQNPVKPHQLETSFRPAQKKTR